MIADPWVLRPLKRGPEYLEICRHVIGAQRSVGKGEANDTTNSSPSHQLVVPSSKAAECVATHSVNFCCSTVVEANNAPSTLSKSRPGVLRRPDTNYCSTAAGEDFPAVFRFNPRKAHTRQDWKYFSRRWVSQSMACLVRCVLTATDASASPIPPACSGVINSPGLTLWRLESVGVACAHTKFLLRLCSFFSAYRRMSTTIGVSSIGGRAMEFKIRTLSPHWLRPELTC